MKLIVTEDKTPQLLTAAYVKKRINMAAAEGKNIVIAFPTGGTAVDMYKQLVAYHKAGELSFKNVITFNLDEYVNLPEGHPQSYHYFMRENLFNHIDILPQNINIPDGNAADLQKMCIAYEDKILQAGGIDLFLGGVGVNGHIAFNEPGTPADTRTFITALTPSTIKANARFFDNDLSKVPTKAASMGLGTIMDSREVLIMAAGQNKAAAIYKAMEANVDLQWPITVLKNHPAAFIVADVKAASEVSTKTKEDFSSCSF